MATAGRGQLLAIIRDCLERAPAQQPQGRGRPAKKNKSKKKSNTGSSGFQSNCPGTQPWSRSEKQRASVSSVPAARSFKCADKSYPASTQNFMGRLPPEILIKILSYLDASSLFCISHVNKLFYQLSNNDAMWHELYLLEFSKRKKWIPKCCEVNSMLQRLSTSEVQDRPAGYWRRLYFRTMVGYNTDKWKKELRAINPYTGLPSKTERVLRNLYVKWELTVSTKSGYESTFEQSQAYFSESSVTVCWSAGHWPPYHQITTLQLHGVQRVALNCPSLKRPGWRSLMAKCDKETLSRTWEVIGTDSLVKLVLLQPGIIVGIWRGQLSIAFIVASFHYHQLVERSILGSSSCPYSVPMDKPPFDDIDLDYGLHGYTLHIILHNTVTEIMSGHFPRLYCRKFHIRDGFIGLIAIERDNLSQHTPLSGNFTLPWKCEALAGTVENCCVMTLTLLDESLNPFWCVSSPVSMELAKRKTFSYDYDGVNFLIRYQDNDGHVKMELIWMKDQSQFFLVNLVVYVAVHKVNKHFGRNY